MPREVFCSSEVVLLIVPVAIWGGVPITENPTLGPSFAVLEAMGPRTGGILSTAKLQLPCYPRYPTNSYSSSI